MRKAMAAKKRNRDIEPANDEGASAAVDEGKPAPPAKKRNLFVPQGSKAHEQLPAPSSFQELLADIPQPFCGLRRDEKTLSSGGKRPANIPTTGGRASPSTSASKCVKAVQEDEAAPQKADKTPQSTKTGDESNEPSQQIAKSAPSAKRVANDVRGPKDERDQIIEFIEELDRCLDGTDAVLKKIRGRRSVTEEMYAAEHQECLKALKDLKTIGDIAEAARQRAYETDCARQWVKRDLTTLTISALVPPLRRASLLWDDVWAFLLQAESQLRRVRLVVGWKVYKRTECGTVIKYSFNIKRKNDKPFRFTEIDEAAPRAVHEFGVGVRSRPHFLNELTDVSCRVLGKCIRCWQAAVISLNETDSESNRWVQKRLRGWWNSEGGEFKSLELDDNGIDRYVSVVSCEEGGAVPETANVIVASIDVGCEATEIRAAIKNLEKVMLSVKHRGVALGLALPVVVVVAVENGFSNVDCFELEVRAVREKGLSNGMASMVKVVRPSEDVIRKLDMDLTFRDMLVRSVDLASIWDCSEGLTLEAVTLKELLLMRGSFAWKEVLVNSRTSDDLNARNTKVLQAINNAWSNVARDMLLQEYRWPVEVVGRREEVRKLREKVEGYAKLPSPGDIGVSSTAEYIAELALEAGKNAPEIDYDKKMHPLWQFCLALSKLIPPLLQTRLGQSWEKEFLLPREKQTLEDFKRKQDIQTRFFNSDRTLVGVILAKKSQRRAQSDMEGAERQGESADRLNKKRRVESEQSYATGRPDCSMNEALLREGEAYAKLLVDTMDEIRTRETNARATAVVRR